MRLKPPECEKGASQACDKGVPTLSVRGLPDQFDRYQTMLSHFQGNAQDDDPDGAEQQDDHEDPVNRDHGPTVNGQPNDEAPGDGDLTLWRPTRMGYEHLGIPEFSLLHFGDLPHEERGPTLRDHAMRIWPDLQRYEWIHALLDASAAQHDGIDTQNDHMIICDALQYPDDLDWRGGLILVELYGDTPGERSCDLHAFAAHLPITKEDTLQRLGIPTDGFRVELSVNGFVLPHDDPGVDVDHGFFMRIRLVPDHIDFEERLLQDLLLTPSDWSAARHRTPSPEGGESEHPALDDVCSISSTTPRSSGIEDRPEASFQASQVLAPTDDMHVGRENEASPVAVNVSIRVENDDADAGSCQSCSERGDHVNSPEANLFVSPHFVKEPLGSLHFQPNSPSPQHDEVDRLNHRSHRISLELLLPVDSPGTRVAAPDADILQPFLRPWTLWPQDPLPDDFPFHGSTTSWIADRHCDAKMLDVLHLFTDGSARVDDRCSSWAWVAVSSNDIDLNYDELRYHGWWTGPVCLDHAQPHFLGALGHDSVTSEASALWWAVTFAYSHHTDVQQVVLHFDALVVGRAMDASFRISDSYPIVKHLRMLMQGLEVLMGPANVHSIHVKGHKGDPLNEMANSLAFFAATNQLSPEVPLDIRPLLANNGYVLKWIWALLRARVDQGSMPLVRDGSLHLLPRHTQVTMLESQDWTFGYGCQQSRNGPFIPCATFATFNVRTLKAPQDNMSQDDFVLGRHTLLESQLIDHGLTVIGLQETRTTKSDVIAGTRYHKFRSAALQGHGGIELWISVMTPLGFSHGRELYFNGNDAVVLHADPDLLLVHWSPSSSLTFIFWVGHAPHKGHPEEIKDAWWNKCRALLCKSADDVHIIGMLDANAAMGSRTTESVQDHAADEEDFNGGLFHDLLVDLELFLPSTFSGMHQGPSVTWFSSAAKQAKGTRNDFVAIPRAWSGQHIQSFVLPDLEVAQKNMDHLAVVLQVAGTPPNIRGNTSTRSQVPIDWTAVRACRDPQVWSEIFAPLTQPPWEYDVHHHWHHCHTQLTAQLRKRFPKKRSFPRKPYITEEVWIWRNKRKSLRRQALLRAHLCPQLDLLVPFQVWAQQVPLRRALLNGILWLLRCHAAHLRDKQIYRDTQAHLKAALQVQRKQYLEKIAEEADLAPPQEIYKKLRAAGFASSRKSRFRPLPFVLQSNGQPATDIETLRKIWRDHFAAIECGHEIPAQELLQLCVYSDIALQYQPPDDLLACMPTLQDFERMLLKCQPNKAAGPDGLVPELCKYAARHMSHFLAPLFLKQACYAAEPIHRKGGILFELYKGKGSMQDASSYRGILVSSHVAKAFHNVYRQEALPYHLATADPLQFGGTPGMGVDFASRTLRLFLRNHQLAGRSCAVFYLDIKSAYYRLLRCLAIGPTCSYNEFIRLMRTMDIPPDAADCLIRATHDPNALTDAGAPEWLRHMGAAFHKHTWYHVRGDNAVTATLRGTRPSDGWADLLFNMVLSKVTKDIEKELCDLGLEIVLTWNGLRSFEAQAPGPVETKAMQITWADDLAILVKHGSASQLLEALPVVISTYIDRLASRGLLLNFGTGKSEVLLLLRGQGSQQLRRDIFVSRSPAWTFTQTFAVPSMFAWCIATNTWGSPFTRMDISCPNSGYELANPMLPSTSLGPQSFRTPSLRSANGSTSSTLVFSPSFSGDQGPGLFLELASIDIVMEPFFVFFADSLLRMSRKRLRFAGRRRSFVPMCELCLSLPNSVHNGLAIMAAL